MPFTSQYLHSALVLLLSILSAQLNNASSSVPPVTCDAGISFNKACESGCNNAYVRCNAISLDNDARILFVSVECGKMLSGCMTDCFAAATDKCVDKAPDSSEGGSNDTAEGRSNDGGNDKDSRGDNNGNGKGRSNEKDGGSAASAEWDAGDALEGIAISIGALVMYLLGKNVHVLIKSGIKEVAQDDVGYDEQGLSFILGNGGGGQIMQCSAVDYPNGSSSDIILANTVNRRSTTTTYSMNNGTTSGNNDMADPLIQLEDDGGASPNRQASLSLTKHAYEKLGFLV